MVHSMNEWSEIEEIESSQDDHQLESLEHCRDMQMFDAEYLSEKADFDYWYDLTTEEEEDAESAVPIEHGSHICKKGALVLH